MFSQLVNLIPLALIGDALAAPAPSNEPGTVKAQVCYATETPARQCYSAPNGEPQDVLLEDINFIAGYLRAYGAQTRAGRLFSMAAADTPDCGEWLLYAQGTAQAFAKHINSTVDSSVLFADIANTIDGGANANDTAKAAALVGCGTDGGAMGVVVNTASPTYTGSTYPAGYVTNGILIKIVASGV